MFCGECGAKNEKGAKFCEKCGAKMATPEGKKTEPQKAQPQQVKAKKPMSKQSKIIIAAVSAFLVLLIVFVSIGSSLSNPTRVAKSYMEAMKKKDYNKLYSLVVDIESGDKTFVDKKAFSTIMDKQGLVEVTNYSLDKVEYGIGKLTATVPATYTCKGGSGEKEIDIKLQKSDKKNLLFFTKWDLSDSCTDSNTVKDYKITVPKDSKVVYAGKIVSKKYLDKDKSTDSNDVYILKQVFNLKTPIKVTLKNGIVIEDTDTPSKYYNSYTARLNSSSISKTMKDNLVKQAKEDLIEMYAGFIANKSFSELSSKSFDSNLGTSYDSYLKTLQNSSRKLTKMEITNVVYSSVGVTSDGYLQLYVKVNYDYTVSYESLGEVKTKDNSSYDYVYLTYEMNGKNYKLRGVRSLPTYFSIY